VNKEIKNDVSIAGLGLVLFQMIGLLAILKYTFKLFSVGHSSQRPLATLSILQDMKKRPKQTILRLPLKECSKSIKET
jgi:hypothetical protein